MMTTQNETLQNLMSDLGLSESQLSESILLLSETESPYLRDLRINLSNALKFQHVNKVESLLIGLAVAVNDKSKHLKEVLLRALRAEGKSETELAEVVACVSLLNVNNDFYRFRHFTNKEYYTKTPAGIKMGIMMKPALGKEFFELLSLAVSALNGCELCVNAHEASLIQLGTSEARIYDAIRCASIFRGFTAIND